MQHSLQTPTRLSDFVSLNGGQLLFPMSREHPNFWNMWRTIPGAMVRYLGALPIYGLPPQMADMCNWPFNEDDVATLADIYPLDKRLLRQQACRTPVVRYDYDRSGAPIEVGQYYDLTLGAGDAWRYNIRRLVRCYTGVQINEFYDRFRAHLSPISGVDAEPWEHELLVRAVLAKVVAGKALLIEADYELAAKELIRYLDQKTPYGQIPQSLSDVVATISASIKAAQPDELASFLRRYKLVAAD
jgi:hypothetical protein